jgi:Type IV pili component
MRSTKTFMAFASGLLLLTACADVEGKYETRTPPQYLSLESSNANMTIAPDRLARGPSAIGAAADDIVRQFRQYGHGRMHLIVSAPNQSESTRQARMVKMALNDRGIGAGRVTVTTVSAPPYGAVVSYQRLDVALPDCPDVPLRDSPLGCGLDRQLGKMIARNSDLLGNDRFGVNQSQPSGVAVERYRSQAAPPTIPSGLPETTNIDN